MNKKLDVVTGPASLTVGPLWVFRRVPTGRLGTAAQNIGNFDAHMPVATETQDHRTRFNRCCKHREGGNQGDNKAGALHNRYIIVLGIVDGPPVTPQCPFYEVQWGG